MLPDTVIRRVATSVATVGIAVKAKMTSAATWSQLVRRVERICYRRTQYVPRVHTRP